MNSLFVRVDLAILPPKQFNFAIRLLENCTSDQDRNMILKGIISLGYFSLNQKELSLFSSNTIKKLQAESKVFKFRIYESPEFSLFSSLSKKARRATINALLYTGVNSLSNLTFEYANLEISVTRKQEIEELIFKTGLFKEFEFVLGKTIQEEPPKNEEHIVQPNIMQINKNDALAKIPIPKLDDSVIKTLVVNQAIKDEPIETIAVSASVVEFERDEKELSSSQTLEPTNSNLSNQTETEQNSTVKKSRWKQMSIDCG